MKPSPNKRAVTYFTLYNKEASGKLVVFSCIEIIKHETTAVYVGVTLDRTLTYEVHLQKLTAKLKTRTFLISKLAGTIWRANAQVKIDNGLSILNDQVLCHLYDGSRHCNLMDVQLRRAMRTITGTLIPTNAA